MFEEVLEMLLPRKEILTMPSTVQSEVNFQNMSLVEMPRYSDKYLDMVEELD